MNNHLLVGVLAGIILGTAAGAAPSGERFTVPPGFVVETVVAPSNELGSIVAMTFDGRARLTVARDGGPIEIVTGNLADGKPTTIKVFSDKVTNCQGLLWLDGDLFANGDGPQGAGLYRLHSSKGDDVADVITCLGKYRGGMGEHGPHGIVLGPDGFLYTALGNHAQAPDSVTDSPLNCLYQGELLRGFEDPNGHAVGIRPPGGTVCRVDRAGQHWERFAGGFRNHYDIAFNALGELFTFDSDMEWDIGLPWYRPVRFNHVIAGGDYGWRSGTACMPDYFADSLPSLCDAGRGSPTGTVVYDHTQFPEKYRGALFACDWSQGRILALPAKRSGACYAAQSEIFLTGRPCNGTDLDVGPDGALYFSTGGRGTEGAIYRVRHIEGSNAKRPVPKSNTSAAWEWLQQPQPDAAWVREPLAAMLREPKWRTILEHDWLAFVRSSNQPVAQRLRALQWLQQFGPPPSQELLIELTKDDSEELRAGATLLLGLHPTDESRAALIKLLHDPEGLVKRRACESLARIGLRERGYTPLVVLLNDADPCVRWAARKALELSDGNLWIDRTFTSRETRAMLDGLISVCRVSISTDVPNPVVIPMMDRVLTRSAVLLQRKLSDTEFLDLLRLFELVLLRANGPLESSGEIAAELGKRFPSGNWRIDAELARLLIAFNAPDAKSQILGELKRQQLRDAQAGGARSAEELTRNLPREMQIHYAYCLGAARTGWTPEQKRKFAAWFEQSLQWEGGNSFKGYIKDLFGDLNQILSDEEKATILAWYYAPKNPAAAPTTPPLPPTVARVYPPADILTFLANDPAARQGSVERGKVLYERLGCARCHVHGAVGPGGIGPDLTTVASRMKISEILTAIVAPSQVISDQFRQTVVKTKKGEIYAGLAAAPDPEKLELILADGNHVTFPRADIASSALSDVSLMPENLLDGRSYAEIADLFAFLTATKK